MGLTWSDRKCKDDTMIVAKAPITDDIKDDVWFLWNIAKKQPKLKEQLNADGLGMSKDQFDGGRWKVIWFYTVKEDSFDEVEVDGETLFQWQQELNDLTSKWIVKLASIKDAIAGSDSDREPSVEDPYDNPDEEPVKKPIKKASSKVVKKAPPKVVKKVVKNSDEELSDDEPVVVKKAATKTPAKAPTKEVKKEVKKVNKAPVLTEEEEHALSAAISAEKKVNKPKPKPYDVTDVTIGAPKKVNKVAPNKPVSRKGISDDEEDY